MEKTKPEELVGNWFSRYLGRWFGFLDDVILILVATGIIILAIILLAEAFSDYYYFATHSIPHIVGELMFVLILMELLRQVLRQLRRHEFSLNPFFFIGVIAGVRGILVIMMRLALGEPAGWQTLTQLGIYAGVVFIMVICYYLSSRAEKMASD